MRRRRRRPAGIIPLPVPAAADGRLPARLLTLAEDCTAESGPITSGFENTLNICNMVMNSDSMSVRHGSRNACLLISVARLRPSVAYLPTSIQVHKSLGLKPSRR